MRASAFRRTFGLATAIGMSLVLSSQVVATTWTPKVALTNTSNGQGYGLATLNSSTAVAIFVDGSKTYTRRTTNSGGTWRPRVQISGGGTWFAAVAGKGTSVDAVWSRTTNFDQDGFLNYRRSTDSGATFAAATPIATMSDPGGFVLYAPAVARGPAGRVAIAWHELSTAINRFQIRVSTDGGATFGLAIPLAATTADYARPPTVAIGDGVIYVAYFVDATRVELRRSLDDGVTWSLPVTIASDAYPSGNIYALSMVANGTAAHFAYSAKSGSTEWVRYRRTADKGATWTAVSNLSPATGFKERRPSLSLAGGVVRAVYEACETSDCSSMRVTYRKRSSGGWSAEEEASHPTAQWATPAGVGYASRVIVVYDADHYRSPYVYNGDLYARTGT